MAHLLLDTTFLIDAERDGGHLDELIDDEDDVAVAVAAITVAELLVGVELATTSRLPHRQQFVDAVVEAVPVISYDPGVAAAHAKLLATTPRQGRPRGAHDLIVAATAQATGRVLVTADTTAFSGLPRIAVRAQR